MRKIIVERIIGATNPSGLLVTVMNGADITSLIYEQYVTVCGIQAINPLPAITDITVTSYLVSDEHFYPSYVITRDLNKNIIYQPITYLSLSLTDATNSINNCTNFSLKSGEFGTIFYPVP